MATGYPSQSCSCTKQDMQNIWPLELLLLRKEEMGVVHWLIPALIQSDPGLKFSLASSLQGGWECTWRPLPSITHISQVRRLLIVSYLLKFTQILNVEAASLLRSFDPNSSEFIQWYSLHRQILSVLNTLRQLYLSTFEGKYEEGP